MEAVNDHGKILKDLVEAAMAVTNASGQDLAATARPLDTVTAALEASGVTGLVTEAAAGIITDAVSNIRFCLLFVWNNHNFSFVC